MDKQGHKDIEGLFKKRNSELDDFEKEALEGFDMLESEQEAVDLKAELDKKIGEQLFSEKRTGLKVYWYAAAGLFLAIGFSVFFLINNKDIGAGKNVADMKEVSQSVSPEGMVKQPVTAEEKKELERANPATPAEEEEKDKEPEKLTTMKKSVKQEISGESEQAPVQSIAAAGKSSGKSDEKPNDLTSLDDKNSDAKFAENKNSNGEKLKVEEDHKSDKGADNQGSKGKDNDGDTRLSNNGPVVTDQLEKETSKKESKTADRSKTKRKEEAQKPGTSDDMKSTLKSDGAAKSYGYTSTTTINNTVAKSPAKDAPAKQQNTDGVPASSPKAADEEVTLETLNEKNITTPALFYSGGQTVLLKDLSEKLKAKGVDKKFDAVVFVNSKQKVEKVKFTSTFDLTKDEKNAIEEILKTLNKFNNSTNKLQDYTLLYRP